MPEISLWKANDNYKMSGALVSKFKIYFYEVNLYSFINLKKSLHKTHFETFCEFQIWDSSQIWDKTLGWEINHLDFRQKSKFSWIWPKEIFLHWWQKISAKTQAIITSPLWRSTVFSSKSLLQIATLFQIEGLIGASYPFTPTHFIIKRADYPPSKIPQWSLHTQTHTRWSSPISGSGKKVKD